MEKRNIHVCPECSSPYLETQVMAVAKMGSTFNWELDYQFPEDLIPTIEQPGTDMVCSNCDWMGTWAETLEVENTALEGLQYDTGETVAAPIPFITSAPSDGPLMPDIELGMLITFNDPAFLYNGEEMVVIGKTLTDARFIHSDVNNNRMTTNGKLVLITMTPSDTDLFQDVVLTYHGPHLVRLFQRGQIQISARKKKELPDLQDTETPESPTTDPQVVFVP